MEFYFIIPFLQVFLQSFVSYGIANPSVCLSLSLIPSSTFKFLWIIKIERQQVLKIEIYCYDL